MNDIVIALNHMTTLQIEYTKIIVINQDYDLCTLDDSESIP